jgi:hypothetical protein
MRKIATGLVASLLAIAAARQGLAETALIETRIPEPRIERVHVNPDGSVARLELEGGATVERVELAELAGIVLKESYVIPMDFWSWRSLISEDFFSCFRLWMTVCWGEEVPEAFQAEFVVHLDEKGQPQLVVYPDGSLYPNRFFNFAALDVEDVELLSVHSYRLVAYKKAGNDLLGVIDLSATPK